jgi:O-antigen/teichoic acid export membrane protein
LGNVVVRLVGAQDRAASSDRSAVLGSGLALTLGASILLLIAVHAVGVARIAVSFESDGLGTLLGIMLLSVPAIGFVAICGGALQGIRDIAGASLTRGVVAPAVYVCGGLLLGRSLDIDRVGLLFVAGAWSAAGFGLWRWWRKAAVKRAASVGPRWPVVRQLLDGGTPLLGVALLAIVSAEAPVLLLGVWEPAGSVGVFGAAIRVAATAGFFLMAVNTIAAPLMAASFRQGDKGDLGRIARLSASMSALGSAPVIVLMLSMPTWLMALFGPEFESGANVLMTLAVGHAAKAVTGPVGGLLMMSGRERVLLRVAVVGAVVNVALAVLLIPAVGMIGAAIGWTMSVITESVLGLVCVRRELGIVSLPGWVRASRTS